jgi:hypothetical protein
VSVIRRALLKASEALSYSAVGYGTDCDPTADVVNATIAELIEAVRKGVPDSKIAEMVDELSSELADLQYCLKKFAIA